MVVFPWFLFNTYYSDIEKVNKIRAAESNRKFFLDIEKEIPELISKIGIFNYALIPGFYNGIKLALSFKKYPNCYSIVDLTKENMGNIVTFKFYINDHKWQSFDISMIQFFSLIGFGFDSKIFTKDNLFSLIERVICNGEYVVVPYAFRFENNECSFNWNLSDVNKMNHPSVSWFTLEGFDLIRNDICFDETQWFLINLMKHT